MKLNEPKIYESWFKQVKNSTSERCLREEFLKKNPDKTICHIACRCKKCSFR